MKGAVLSLLCAIVIAQGRELPTKQSDKTCNCNPNEAQSICAERDSDNILIAHEYCNKFYKCANGFPIAFQCNSPLLYDPFTEVCDWPQNVDCGDRPIYEPATVTPEDDNDNGDNVNGENRPCNCNPAEAPSICANEDSEGTLIAHENCNQYYICNHGVPVSMSCSSNLLYNPYNQSCDWPLNVECGDRVIPEDDGNDIGGGDNGGGDGDETSPETCNCNPEEAPSICAASGSDSVLIAHENCDQYYQCNHGVPVPMKCTDNLLYNPYTERCDWPNNVDCGNRVVPCDCDDENAEDCSNETNSNETSGSDNDSNNNGEGNNEDSDSQDEDQGNENEGSGIDGEDNGNSTCNCNPGEAPGICAADGSDSVLVAHENCNKFYKCAHGVPVALKCYGNLLYNPYTEQCDWPENVDCGDRIIPDTDDSENDNGGGDNGGGDNGGGDNGSGDNGGGDNGGGDIGGGTCNCNPGEAPGICAADGSDGVLVAHESCNKFYKCAHGVPVALKCPGNLLYNPYTEQCDWPENVDCGDRIIPDTDDSGNDNGGGDNGGGDNGGGDNGGGDNGGGDNGGGDNGGGDNGGDDNGGSVGGGNCDPSEAPAICAADDSDGILVAHEKCNKYYICNHGVPVARPCPGSLLFNPQTDKCDWPENVDCGDRVIPDPEDEDNGGGDNGGGDNGGGDNGGGDNGGSDNGGGDNGGGDNGGGDNGGGDNGGSVGGGNCDPSEAPAICAADDSDGILVAHEKCNKYYICNHGVPVARPCPGSLLFNPQTDKCDWPENVDCGDRVIPDPEDGDNGGGDNGGGDNGDGDNGDGDNGGSDNGGGDNGGGDNGGGTCNCNPGEAPGICAADGSDGVLVAHESCNKFYKCAHGVPVALKCPGNLLYNPYTEQCDWPENVDCGDRIIPDTDDSGNDNGGGDNGSGDNGGGDNGGGDNGGGDNGGGDNGGGDNGGGDNGGSVGGGNCDPSEAPAICAADDSDGILVAHEKCNKYYICNHGVPVARPCPGSLLFNPQTDKCDWPENVDCGDRVIPDPEDGDNGGGDSGGGDNGGGDNGGGDNGGGDNGGGDNGGGDNGGGDNGGSVGGGNCDPSEAPAICAADDSDGILVAHEKCNKYYICNHGVPVARPCPGSLLFNPQTDKCDWPENVDCGDRVIPDPEDGGNGGGDNGGGDNGGGDNGGGDNGGSDNGGGDNGGGDNGGGTCNCNPGEAPGICAADGSDGVLVAHESCNKFYKCAHGVPVALKCPGNLLYNPYTEQCDWPENVDCGDRIIPDTDDSGNDNGGGDNGGGDNGGGDNGGGDNGGGDNGGGDNGGGDNGGGDNGGGDNGGGDNGGGDNGGSVGGGNCDPSEAPAICAADDSDGILVAHEKCNKYYICNHGVPVARPCPGSLLFNPQTDKCDWPENVDCGDRVIPDPEDGDNGGGDSGGGDNGGGDNGGGDNGGGDNGGGDNGGGDNGGGDNGGGDNGGGDNGGGDNGGGDNGGGDNGGGTCNCNPGEAPGICAADGSDGVLVAHESCNKFYKCAHGVPVALKCPGNLLYNPYTEQCDWPENVDCGDRIIPDTDDSGNDNGGGDNGGGDNGGGDNGGGDNGGGDNGGGDNGGGDNGGGDNGGGDNGGGDNGGGDNGGSVGGGNCDPSEAPAICAADDSDGILVAHEKCNKYYICNHGVPVARPCPGSLLFNPQTDKCDWPENVDCGDRVIPDPEDGDNGGGDSGGGDNGGGDNGGGDNGGGDNGGGDNGGGDNGGGDNGGSVGGGNCDPSEAPAICAADDSDGILVAHEKCNKYYICNHGVPVARPCPGSLLFNPQTDKCDWPENVDCGDRVIPDPEDGDNGGGDNGGGDNGGGDNGGGDNGGSDNGGGDNGGGDNGGGTCNCNPGEAPGICAADGSDGVLVAHESCNKFYKCAHGVPVALKCPGNLLYNPYTEQCDWPENVDCGDRIIPDTDDSGNDNGGGDNGGGDNGGGENGGGDNGGGDNGGGDNGGGTCNCNPGEAPGICAADGSDGVLVAHESCNKFYKCAHGVPVALKCPGNLLYNPYTEQCDWPENVDCGDRIIPDTDDSGNDNGGGDNGGGDNGGGDNGGGDNGGGDIGGGDNGGGDNGGGTCNCNPGEAPGICAADGSDGVLVAHESCNKFYKCAHGVPVALKCPGNLLYNPYTEQCDWPENVDCGDRIIPDTDDSGNDNGGGDNGGGDNGGGDNGGGDNGAGDNGGGDNGGGDNGGGTCNCNPGEAPGICAADGSDGVLVAHEICNKFYKCANGVPVALKCPGNLLYNPYTEQCDWPENVDCGDRIIPDTDDSGNDNGGGDNGGGDNGGGDNGGGDNGGGDNGGGDSGGGTCNCNPGEAPSICAADGSDGVLVAHESCNKFYKCANGVPVALKCPGNLLYNPYTEQCDWPENVDCGDRIIPDTDDSGNDNGGGDNGGGDNGGGDNGGGDNGGGDNGSGTCNCNPGEAPGICAADGSDGVLVAHESCNKFYKCANGVPVALKCPGNLLYNPYTEQCDWPENVDCGDRIIPDTDDSGNDNGGGDIGGGDNGGGDNGGGDNGGGDNGGGDNGGGTCNCNPGEAPGICAADGSDGVLVAHESCNKFYKCANGVPVALKCPGNLLYNPYTEQCDWPENVDCGDRIIPDTDDSGNDNGGGDNGGGDNGGGDNGGGDNGGGDNGGGDSGGGTCNCNPGEAPGICAADGSDGVLVAHESCNKFYKCANCVPVALKCPGNLLYNPYTEQCDWPENVDCGDRIIPDTDDSGNDNGGGDNGGDDNGGVDNEGGDNGGGTCNCNPGEASGICAADGSNGVLVAHESCNKFYKCANGVPVALKCYGNLLYNPYTEQCDWPENVDCGDRIIPDTDDSGNDNGGGDNVGSDNGGSDNGGHYDPSLASQICAAENSDNVIVAHENCNKFYICDNGKPITMKCPNNLMYNPSIGKCDWQVNVDCDNRIVTEDSDNGNSPCNCDPRQATPICSREGSDGMLIAHENCNQYYMCKGGSKIEGTCPANLSYNPIEEACDWQSNVNCGDRSYSTSHVSLNKHLQARNGLRV